MMQTIQKSGSQLFYKQYRYSVHLRTSGIVLVRAKNHDIIDFTYEKNNSIYKDGDYNILRRFSVIEDPKTLHLLMDVVLKYKDHIRIFTVNWDNIRIYFNDTKIIDDIKCIPKLEIIEIAERVVDRPHNAVVLKQSHFKYRSYFSRPKKYIPEIENNIRQSLVAQPPKSFRPSPLLDKWIKNNPLNELFKIQRSGSFGRVFYPRLTMIESQMFLDYNDESIITLLNLIKPGIIRKTLDIIVDK